MTARRPRRFRVSRERSRSSRGTTRLASSTRAISCSARAQPPWRARAWQRRRQRTNTHAGASRTAGAKCHIAGRSMCAIDGTQHVSCMGEGEDGEIGNGGYQATDSPVQVFVDHATQLATSCFGTCALLEDGSLSCWGSIDPGDGAPGTYATPHASTVRGVSELTGHFNSYCAIANGGVLCWGANTDGQLGRGSRGIAATPQPLNIAAPTAMAVGDGHGCALAGGLVQCWGENGYGQAGNSSFVHCSRRRRSRCRSHHRRSSRPAIPSRACGATARPRAGAAGSAASSAPAPAVSSIAPSRLIKTNIRSGAQSIAIGRNHTCVIDDNQTLTCYGSNSDGQLGDGTQTESVNGTGPALSPVDQVVAGEAHTCARKVGTPSTISCWGNNGFGQIGNGGTFPQSSPVMVNGLGACRRSARAATTRARSTPQAACGAGAATATARSATTR